MLESFVNQEKIKTQKTYHGFWVVVPIYQGSMMERYPDMTLLTTSNKFLLKTMKRCQTGKYKRKLLKQPGKAKYPADSQKQIPHNPPSVYAVLSKFWKHFEFSSTA